MTCCAGRTGGILADLFGPEFILHRNMGETFRKHPVAARVGFGTAATLSGLVKPLICPLIAALGLVLMPIKAGVASYKGDVEGAKANLKAWGFCCLTIVATVAFFAVTTYCMPLLWSSALAIAILSLSVICHVHKAMKEPESSFHSN
ncbi:MAG: hypothetical protein JJU12_06500 [Chlamydiales bacterium]|nr:hypothetical protein [Chlamydiales bacterium]